MKLALFIAGVLFALYCHCRADDVPALNGAYSATVLSVHDGDTIKCDITLGFGLELRNVSIRLVSVFAPELGKPGGFEATAKLKELLPVGVPIIIRPVMTVNGEPNHEVMTFQRYVGRIWRKDLDICEEMNRYLAPSTDHHE